MHSQIVVVRVALREGGNSPCATPGIAADDDDTLTVVRCHDRLCGTNRELQSLVLKVFTIRSLPPSHNAPRAQNGDEGCSSSLSLFRTHAITRSRPSRQAASRIHTGRVKLVDNPDALAVLQRVAARNGWQLGHHTVVRCVTTPDLSVDPHVRHVSPARPYTRCLTWNEPRDPSGVR